MAAPPPDTESDRASWRALLAIAVEAAGSQTALADLLRQDRSSVSYWLDGRRTLAWPTLRAALLRVATRRPSAVPEMVAALASELLGARGRWLPEDVDPVGPYADESADVTIAHGELSAALRRGDRAATLAAARRLVEEAEEAARAAVATQGGEA